MSPAELSSDEFTQSADKSSVLFPKRGLRLGKPPCPTLPGVGEFSGFEESACLAVLTVVDARNVCDGETVPGWGADFDGIAGRKPTFLDDPQVASGAIGSCECQWKPGVLHANAELEARHARLADLQDDIADLPTLAHDGRPNVDPLRCEVVAECSRIEGAPSWPLHHS